MFLGEFVPNWAAQVGDGHEGNRGSASRHGCGSLEHGRHVGAMAERRVNELWSMATMATLTSTSQAKVKSLFLALPRRLDGHRVHDGDIMKALEGNRFQLGYYIQPDNTPSYGINIIPEEPREDKGTIRPTIRDAPHRTPIISIGPSSKFKWATRLTHRDTGYFGTTICVLFLVLIIGLLILILYYENTVLDTPFEAFMDSQLFGVRILFTSFGTVIGVFWDYYFSCTYVPTYNSSVLMA